MVHVFVHPSVPVLPVFKSEQVRFSSPALPSHSSPFSKIPLPQTLDESESSHAVINIALIHIQNNTFFITNSRSLNKCNNVRLPHCYNIHSLSGFHTHWIQFIGEMIAMCQTIMRKKCRFVSKKICEWLLVLQCATCISSIAIARNRCCRGKDITTWQ